MPAKNTKCTNIWNFLTPLDSMHLAIFLENFLLFFNSNLKTRQILRWFGFLVQRSVYRTKPIELQNLIWNLNSTGFGRFRLNRSGIPVMDRGDSAWPVGEKNPGGESWGSNGGAEEGRGGAAQLVGGGEIGRGGATGTPRVALLVNGARQGRKDETDKWGPWHTSARWRGAMLDETRMESARGVSDASPT
jgi:hypothetical protein